MLKEPHFSLGLVSQVVTPPGDSVTGGTITSKNNPCRTLESFDVISCHVPFVLVCLDKLTSRQLVHVPNNVSLLAPLSIIATSRLFVAMWVKTHPEEE
jgi:hypothetical protein